MTQEAKEPVLKDVLEEYIQNHVIPKTCAVICKDGNRCVRSITGALYRRIDS